MSNKLILHFDARNTLFVADFNSRQTMEKALNCYISGLVWGSVENGIWKIAHDEISTTCPNNSLISFYKYKEGCLVKKSSDRPKLREELGKFTQEVENQFEPIYLHHLKLLEWTDKYHKFLTIKGGDGKFYHYILPTFFNTVQILHKTKRDFAIIIRTFGLDITHILNAINAFLNGEHPMFPEPLDIHLCSNTNELKMDTSHQYIYQYKSCDSDEERTTCSNMEIVEHWNSINGISAVRDDFQYWCDNDYHYSASKPLWINYGHGTSEQFNHHIFFDDCIRPRDTDSIVHLRQMRSDHSNNCISNSISTHDYILSPSETLDYIDVNLVQSDLLECISNPLYFISKIEICEQRYKEMEYRIF